MDTLSIGLYIKEKIKIKGITQDQLAQKLNITSSAVSQVLNGRNMFDVLNLQSLSRILDEPIDKILNAGGESPTYLELLALKRLEEYIIEDPNLEKMNETDYKGNKLIEYILKHENIELVKLFEHDFIFRSPNDIRLETILIKNDELELLNRLYSNLNHSLKKKFMGVSNNYISVNHYQDIKNKLTENEKKYLKTLFSSNSKEIYELSRLFTINYRNSTEFSTILEYAIMFDAKHIVEYDIELRLSNDQMESNNQKKNLIHKIINLLKIAIIYQSNECIEYCYNLLEEFYIKDYFEILIETKDIEFIRNFINKYKNKSDSRKIFDLDKDSKFDNSTSLNELIVSNNLEILKYSVEFSNNEALDKALKVVNPEQTEIIKLLIHKGATFSINDSYNKDIKLDTVTAVIKYLLSELDNKK